MFNISHPRHPWIRNNIINEISIGGSDKFVRRGLYLSDKLCCDGPNITPKIYYLDERDNSCW